MEAMDSSTEEFPIIEALYSTSCSSEDLEEDASKEDDEMQLWREAIREQVEKDIDRQVRLRLNLDPLQHYSANTPVQNELYECTSYKPSRTWLRTPLLPARQEQRTDGVLEDTVCSGSQLVEESSAMVSTIAQKTTFKSSSSSFTIQARPRQKTSVEYVRQSNIERKDQVPENQIEKNVADHNHELTGVYHYLHTKYGTPVSQLQNLASNGHFKCKQMATSVKGATIKYPVEASCCQLAPRHKKTKRRTHSLASDPDEHTVKHMSPHNVKKTTLKRDVETHTSSTIRRGKIVFDNKWSSTTGENTNQSLVFESRFEGGNLRQAYQIGASEYQLVLSPDLYSKRHTQWFYFRVEGMNANQPYTFHIINFKKPDSLYNYGMQPLLYSDIDANNSGDGWSRKGYSIKYYSCHGYNYPQLPNDGDFYTLTWSMEFPHTNDTCYMAHCYPYPYSGLLDYINQLEQCPHRTQYLSSDTLCHTLAGNKCPLLTITDFEGNEMSSRAGIVLTARVHPGETNSSWMMQGLLDFLTSECSHAKSLRAHFVFKVVPMLNPDGVIVGNYRTSLAGVDLNRVYKSPRPDLFPTVYHTKAMVERFMKERTLLLYVDLHGHSRKHNVFMYGCHVPQCDHAHFLNERIIPYLLSQSVPDMFDFLSCKFGVQRCKEATGRVVTWKMGVPNAFTMESTFSGSTLRQSNWQFSEEDLMAVGTGLGESMYKYLRFLNSPSYQQKMFSQLAEQLMSNVSSPQATGTTEPLPDIVTSTTDNCERSRKISKQKSTKNSSRILRKFMKFELSLLEKESSTSGSDSENDEFSYRKKKSRKPGQGKKKRAKSFQIPTQHQIELPQQIPLATRMYKSHAVLRESGFLAPLKLHASAPARLQRASDAVGGHGRVVSEWKFVNRYQSRSNGGIPMFSEERLRERAAKKQQLQSLSMVHTSSGSQEQKAHATARVQKVHSSIHISRTNEISPYLWRPMNDPILKPGQLIPLQPNNQLTPLQPKSQLLPNGQDRNKESLLVHYQNIKSLVSQQLGGSESQVQKFSSAEFKSNSEPRRRKLIDHVHHLSDRQLHERSHQKDLQVRSSTLPATGKLNLQSTANYRSTSIPPHIAKYISEIWSDSTKI